MNPANGKEADSKSPDLTRRGFFHRFVTFFMSGSLLASYGSFFLMAFRFIYPSQSSRKEWLYITQAKKMKPGESLIYRAPDGVKIAVARRGSSGRVEDFIALSSTCPHLGCQVRWEGPKERFFCPCHNGVFDPSGRAISGPPAESKLSLARYPLKIEKEMLFIEFSLGNSVTGEGGTELPNGPQGPGHDPVLFARQNFGLNR